MSVTQNPRRLTPPLMLCALCPCWWARWVGAGWSHCEGDEAVVSLNVPLEDLGARPEHALEARPVQLDALEWAPGDHGGRPGPVQQQGDLACRRVEKEEEEEGKSQVEKHQKLHDCSALNATN